MKPIKFLGAVLGASLAAVPAAADGYKAIAKEFSRGARKAGIERVAVLPLTPTDGSDPGAGWSIAERITTQLVRGGRVKAVERGLLRQIMEEHYLGKTGIIDQAALRQVGKILSVDAVVTGTFVSRGRKLAANIRLVHVESGLILAACERTVEREWSQSARREEVPIYAGAGPDRAAVWGMVTALARGAPLPDAAEPRQAAPEPPHAFAVLEPSEREGLRDSLRDLECSDVTRRVNALEESILDLKARFWAFQLKDGLSLSELSGNPGSTISDPELRRSLEERVKAYYASAEAAPLSDSELKKFMLVNEQAFRLHQDCGI